MIMIAPHWKLSVAVALLFSVFPVVILGQTSTANIDGRVVDPSGAAIAGATVTAVHSETGAARLCTANAEGAYIFASLPIGTYDLSVQQVGFKKALKTGIILHVNDRLSLDMALEIGDLAQEVSVTANRDQVQTETSEQSGLITGDQVRELQLNGRSFVTLLELVPGVASELPDRADPNTQVLLNVNGGRNTQASFNIDGGDNSDLVVGGRALNTFTSVETIAEFKILSSGFSAEYGRGGFSQINVVTKGGTKDFHGSLHEYFRNDALDARDFFSHQVLPLRLNNFGYTVGGPVLFPGGYNRSRGKTFFFFAQDFNRLSQQQTALNTTVPTAEERSGDFRALGPGRDGAFGTADDPVIDPQSGVGFPGGVIPPSRIDPNARKMIALYPLPNFAGPSSINYTSAVPGHQNWREDLIRIDQNLSSIWKLFGRYVQDSASILNPYGGTLLSQSRSRFPGNAATTATRPGKNLTVNLTSGFSQNLLNEFRFTYSGRETTQKLSSDQLNRSKVGINIPELFPENDANAVPALTLSGYAAISVPGVQAKKLFNLEFADNLTKIKGRHLLKSGFLYSFGGNREQRSSMSTNGSYSFTTGFSKNPVANLLLGLPFSYSEEEHVLSPKLRFGVLEAYVQDDVKAGRRLTLNLGVRYSNYFNPYEINNELANFAPGMYDPARAPRIDGGTGRPVPGSGDSLNGLILAGKNSPWGRRVTPNNTQLIGPRAGFAWDVFGTRKTAFRGGYGIYYTRPLINGYIVAGESNPPFSRSITIQQPPFSNPGGGTAGPVGVSESSTLGTPMQTPTVQQWSFGIQQETPGNGVLSISYVGSHGTHLARPININSAQPGEAAAKKVNVNAVAPFLGWGTITEQQTSGSSIYHSLQASLKLRMRRALMAGAAYTFSRSIDDASSEVNNSDMPQNSYDIRAERGPSSFDRTHILTFNFIWSLPKFARGSLSQTVLRTLVDDWKVSGIGRMWSGRPLNVTMSQDVAGIGAVQNQRPNVIADTRGPKRIDQWFNTAAFARPASGTFGNLGRNSMRGPGVNKWDLTAYKDFTLSERVRLQLRSEFFNAFNHPSFNTIGTALNTTANGVNLGLNSFGTITGTRDARVLQFALRMTF